jgi:predicted nicotinamide N-methyase
MVVWQSGFVLAELLLRRPPLGPWPGVKVMDLGSGTGVCTPLLSVRLKKYNKVGGCERDRVLAY